MKKYLIFTITLFLFIRVQAVTEKYSEWSSEYPTEISKLLIRKEDRYLWYKDVITDEEYIMKELVKDKIIDYNDIVQKKSDGESIIKPDSYISRTIHRRNKMYTFKSNDIDSINFIFNNSDISEIEIFILNEKINYEINDEYSFLYDKDYNNYNMINTNINIKLDNKYDFNDIVIKIYYDNNSSIYVSYKCYIYDIYYNDFNLDKDILIINNLNMKPKLSQMIPMYSYTDRLYRTYKLVREYTKEYYSELEVYIKDENTKKEFYSYLLNDYVILDDHGNIVKNENYCIKNFCSIKIIEEENPKTGDFIEYSFILLLISFITISLMLFIFYKKIVDKKI